MKHSNSSPPTGTQCVPLGNSVHQPLIIPQTVCLGEIAPQTNNHYGVFLTDDDGQIVGLVNTEDIHNRLNTGHPRERERWAQSPLSSLLLMRLSLQECFTGANLQSFEASTAILDQGRMIGIATEDDFLLSWRFIQPVLAKAATDPLTLLMNENFEYRLHEEWDRSSRLKQSIGVILCDIDHFKPVNDTYGHQFGDRVIQSIAITLENHLRTYDLVSRYGGDEFICLCIGCRPQEITIPIRRIQNNIQSLEHRFGDQRVHVSASIGAAVCHGGFDQWEPTDLVKFADDCLYRAKSEGRGLGYFMDFNSDPHSTMPGEMAAISSQEVSDINPSAFYEEVVK